MYLSMLIAAALTLSTANADQAAFRQAITDLEADRVDAAYSLFESIPASDPYFVEALVELQKIHYRRQQWQHFFGYATYYRKNLVSSSSALNPRMISLELMALAKHCLWPEAQAIGQGALAFAREHSAAGLAEIESTMTHLKLTREFPKAISATANTKRPATVFAQDLYWRVPTDGLKLVAHPKNLRMVVTSRCPQ